jgi:hypothetical protein
MKNNFLLILPLLVAISSCANQPPVPIFADIANQNESKKAEYNRIEFNVEADCEDGECTVSEDTLIRIGAIIKGLNDEMELRVNAYNLSIDSLSHCQYGYSILDQALINSEKAQQTSEITHVVKNVLGGALCMGLLWAK